MATSILTQAKTAASCPKAGAKGRPRRAAAPVALHPQGAQAVAAAPTRAEPDAPVWGHLGLRLAGDEFTRWYPISQEQAGGLIAQLRGGSPWIATHTLNNRALLIQPAAVQRLVILDDDADEPEGDWCVSWENAAGFSQAVYSALWECYLAGSGEGVPRPDRGIVESRGLDEQALHAMLRLTHLHYRYGTAATLRLDERASWAAFNAVQHEWEQPALMHLPCWGEGRDFYAPRDQVALLDMPLHLMLGAARDELAELRASRKRAA